LRHKHTKNQIHHLKRRSNGFPNVHRLSSIFNPVSICLFPATIYSSIFNPASICLLLATVYTSIFNPASVYLLPEQLAEPERMQESRCTFGKPLDLRLRW